MKALTIWQPWAWLIVTGTKPVENRTWATDYRGPMLIHAGKHQFDENCLEMLAQHHQRELCMKIIEHFEISITKSKLTVGIKSEFGGIVGAANLRNCVWDNPVNDLWAEPGLCHWQYRDAVELPFVLCSGAQGLWNMNYNVLGSVFNRKLKEWMEVNNA